MRNYIRKLIYLLNNQHFSDGLRISFSILFPAVLFSQLENIQIAFPFCLGTLCTSITDSPGAWEERKNGMLITCFSILFTAIVTGLIQSSLIWMGFEVIIFCFICSMLPVYNLRTSLIGTATLLVMVLLMNKSMPLDQVIITGLTVFAGGIWYFAVSFIFFFIRPLGHAEKALGECMIGIGRYISIKSGLYQKEFSIGPIILKSLDQQIKVNALQELCREQILKSNLIMESHLHDAEKLIIGYIKLQDLYENIVGTHFNYEAIRTTSNQKNILSKIADSLNQIGDDLKLLGHYLETGQAKNKLNNRSIEKINQRLELLLINDKLNIEVQEVAIKIRDLTEDLSQLKKIILSPSYNPLQVDFRKFKLEPEPFTIQPFIENLSKNSSVFRHAIRVTVVATVGFLIGKLILKEGHSYWILLTSIFILKPSYSLTKQRNLQRILGTLAGAAIGFVLLFFVKDKTLLFIIMSSFMIAAYTVQRTNYVLLILFITPYIFIIFNFLGVNVLQILEERVVDTLIGCALAFVGAYVILPHWESDKIKDLMKQLVQANIKYLQNAIEFMKGSRSDETGYRWARKEVYISTANLQGAYQRMKSEPSKVRYNLQVLHEFILLNHSLTSIIAGLNTGKGQADPIELDRLNHSVESLQVGVKSIDTPDLIAHNKMSSDPTILPNGLMALDETVKNINQLINKLFNQKKQ